MNNKETSYIILVLSIIIIWIGSIIFIDYYMNNDKNIIDNKIIDNKIVNNTNNNIKSSIEKEKIEKNLKDWKKEQIKNYKFATNLKFWSWKIVNIDLEAREVELELMKWVKTKMNTYNVWNSIEPLVIKAKKWDKIVVNFKNSLKEETTIHWHGIRLPNSEDWVPWVTQKPIPAWWKYNYSFVVNDAWTFLFHPHKNHSKQIWVWLYWILVVEDDSEPKYDKEFTWVLKDYRVLKNWTLAGDFWNIHDATHGWRLWNIMTINNIVNYEANVNPWDTIRLRIANMSNARIYNLDLSKFNAKVIATDVGVINNPKRVYNLEVWVWERYELEIKIWLKQKKLEFIDHYFNRSWPNKLATINVVWKVNTKNKIETPKWNLPDWRKAKYNKPDIVIDLGWIWVMWWDKWTTSMMGGAVWWKQWWTINDGIFPETSKPIKLKKWKMYIIRMKNNSRRDHPMHLHWDFFQVIRINWINWEYIWWKDTVLVKAKEYIDVAIIPTNEWTWAFHCHILDHADLGMFTTVNVEK